MSNSPEYRLPKDWVERGPKGPIQMGFDVLLAISQPVKINRRMLVKSRTWQDEGIRANYRAVHKQTQGRFSETVSAVYELFKFSSGEEPTVEMWIFFPVQREVIYGIGDLHPKESLDKTRERLLSPEYSKDLDRDPSIADHLQRELMRAVKVNVG